MDDTKFLQRSHEPSENYTKSPNVVTRYYAKHIGSVAYWVYQYYCMMVNEEEGYAFPKIPQTAKDIGMSESTILRANEILEEFKLIKKVRGLGRAHNSYTIRKPSRSLLRAVLKKKSE